MDAERRGAVARIGRRELDALHGAVLASWVELMPVALDWAPGSRRRAEAAARSALEGMLIVFHQSDLDDVTWERTRETVYANGRATDDEIEDLLRSVRVVAVERLGDILSEEIDFSWQERWELQREAAGFCAELLGRREELDAEALDSMLAELELNGPDQSPD